MHASGFKNVVNICVGYTSFFLESLVNATTYWNKNKLPVMCTCLHPCSKLNHHWLQNNFSTISHSHGISLPYKWVFNSKSSRNGSTQKVLSLWHSLKNSCCAKHLNTKNLHELIQLSEIEDRAKAGILLWNKRVNWVEPDPLIWTELSTYSTALLIFPVWEPEAGVTEENPQNNR